MKSSKTSKGHDPLIKYRVVRPHIQTGDHLAWASDSLIGKIIRWKTKSEVNHSALAITFHEYDEKRVFLLQAEKHGLELRCLSDEMLGYKGRVWWQPLRPPLHQYRHDIGKMAMVLAGRGIGYDYEGLSDNWHGRVSENPDKFFCSEFYGYCLRETIPFAHLYEHQMVNHFVRWLWEDGTALTPGDIFIGLPLFGRTTLIYDGRK